MVDEPSASLSLPARVREGGRPLAALLTLALLVKLVTLLAALDENPLARLATSDSRYYLERAQGLAGVVDDPLADEPHHLPPLYPLVLSVTPGVLDGSFGGVMALQALAGTALVLSVYLLARRRASRTAALVAAGLTLLYGPLTFFETKLLGDSLATFLLVAALVIADGLADRPGTGRGAVLGAVLAAATLLRPQVLLVAAVLGFWVGRRPLRCSLAGYLVAFLVVLAPFTSHNWARSGDVILVSDNGGVNLWLANTGPMVGTFATNERAFGNIDDQASQARRLAESRTGEALSWGAVSRWYSGQALRAILDAPPVFGERVVLRARALLESFETGIVTVPEVERRFIPPLGVLILPFGVLLGLAGAAWVLALRPTTALRPPPAPIAPMLAVGGMVVLTALLFFHYSRFRLPLVPLLAVAIAQGIDRVRRDPPGIPWSVVAAAVAAGVIALSYVPGPHHANTLAGGWTNIGDARLRLAGRDERRSASEAALADARRALEHDGGFLRAHLLAAQTALTLGRYDECAEHLEHVERAAPDDGELLVTATQLALLPDPANRHHDLARARQLIDQMLLIPEVLPMARSFEQALEAQR